MAAPTFLSLLHAGATREQLEEWCRGKTQSYPVGGNGVTCRVLGKHIMVVASGDSALTPHLVLDGIWEPWVTMAIARHVKPGMRCMDVGACYGYYALLMADLVGPTGHVQAWEPVWRDLVEQNVGINGFGNIRTEGFLMGTGDGQWCFQIPKGPFNAGDVRLMSGLPVTGKELVVRTRAPAPERIDFIKIDVEGAEADVWEALKEVRDESPNLTVCMEFTPVQHENPDRFLLKLVAGGFELGTVGHDGVPRRISLVEALVPDTGGFRMLWLTRRA